MPVAWLKSCKLPQTAHARADGNTPTPGIPGCARGKPDAKMPSHGVLVKIDCMDTGPIIDQLRTDFPGLLAIYGFGSRFSGQASPQSDLDLAILVEGKATAEALWAESNRLADRLGMDVDLVDLRSASTVMQYQIVTTGQRLWERDAQADIYESYILSEKTDLDALRSGQIEDIQHSGRIYDR